MQPPQPQQLPRLSLRMNSVPEQLRHFAPPCSMREAARVVEAPPDGGDDEQAWPAFTYVRPAFVCEHVHEHVHGHVHVRGWSSPVNMGRRARAPLPIVEEVPSGGTHVP